MTKREYLCYNFTCLCGNQTEGNTSIGVKNNCLEGPNTEQQLPHSIWLIVLLGVAALFAVIVTVIGNILVLLSFKLERSLRRTTNCFIASLAVSDLLIGVFSMPSFTLYLLFGYWPLGEIVCDIWLSLDWTLCLVSQYTVLFITTDRFCTLKYPLRYRNWRKNKKVKIVIATVWIISSSGCFTTIMGWQYFVGERTISPNSCDVQFFSDPLFSFVFTIAYFWIPLVIMIILYVGIYCIALSQQRNKKLDRGMEIVNIKNKVTDNVKCKGNTMACGKQVNNETLRYLRHTHEENTLTPSSHNGTSNHTEKEKSSKLSLNRAPKALKTISIILGAYVLAWSPYHIIVFIKGVCGDSYCINIHLYYFTYWLCYLNSSVNPFCYTFANAKFKKTFVRILKLDLRRT